MSVFIRSRAREENLCDPASYIDAVSQKVIDIPTYVQKLQKTGLFASLDYTGYTYQSQEKTYSLALSCILKSDETETEIETGGAEN